MNFFRSELFSWWLMLISLLIMRFWQKIPGVCSCHLDDLSCFKSIHYCKLKRSLPISKEQNKNYDIDYRKFESGWELHSYNALALVDTEILQGQTICFPNIDNGQFNGSFEAIEVQSISRNCYGDVCLHLKSGDITSRIIFDQHQVEILEKDRTFYQKYLNVKTLSTAILFFAAVLQTIAAIISLYK